MRLQKQSPPLLNPGSSLLPDQLPVYFGSRPVATFSASAPLRTALLWILTLGLLAPALRAQLSTEDHLQDPGFWPTQPAESRSGYTGPEACRQCHAEKFADQAKTGAANDLAGQPTGNDPDHEND